MNKNQPSKQKKLGLGASRARSDAEVLRRLAGVRLLSLDVDGVMTDGDVRGKGQGGGDFDIGDVSGEDDGNGQYAAYRQGKQGRHFLDPLRFIGLGVGWRAIAVGPGMPGHHLLPHGLTTLVGKIFVIHFVYYQ